MTKSKLASDEKGLILADVFDDLNSDIPISAVNTCLDNFVSIIDDVCQPLFEKSCTNTATKIPSFVYNHECEIKKILFFFS